MSAVYLTASLTRRLGRMNKILSMAHKGVCRICDLERSIHIDKSSINKDVRVLMGAGLMTKDRLNDTRMFTYSSTQESIDDETFVKLLRDNRKRVFSVLPPKSEKKIKVEEVATITEADYPKLPSLPQNLITGIMNSCARVYQEKHIKMTPSRVPVHIGCSFNLV